MKAWLVVLACVVFARAVQGAVREPQPIAEQAALLLSLPAAVTNWAVATADLPGAEWADGTNPCGGDGAPPWKGVNCTNGSVSAVDLHSRGLQGTLPGNLSSINSLAALNLSANGFNGGLPAAWLQPELFASLESLDLRANAIAGSLTKELTALASRRILLGSNQVSGRLPEALSSLTLEELDLSDNKLTGLLPPAWGDKTALPRLESMRLDGNQLRGPIPDPTWTSVGFHAPCTLRARPGNAGLQEPYTEPGLCGPLLAISPRLFDPAFLLNPAKDVVIDKPQSGSLANMTTLVVAHADLFTPGSLVTITNTMGTCQLPCSSNPALPGPDTGVITTNIFDLAWEYSANIHDLLLLNPGAGWWGPGASLALPCYPPGKGMVPDYFGGSVAYLQFAGGHELPGLAGLAGAMAAGGVNDHLPNQNDFDTPYTGSEAAVGAGNATRLALVEPVYLFVDLEVSFQVSTVVITAGGAMRNASIYVGNDTASVQGANTLVAAGIDIPAKGTVAVPANLAAGRWVILWTGSASEGSMSASDLQVYAMETNAAAFKPVTVSATGSGANVSAVVDSSPDTCATIQAGTAVRGQATISVDLGYSGTVGSVAVRAGPSLAPGTVAQVLVKQSAGQALQEALPCGEQGLQLEPGAYAAVACNVSGRYIELTVPLAGQQALEVCDLQVGLTTDPVRPSNGSDSGGSGGSSSDGSSSSDGGLSGGAIAGIVIGSVAALSLAAAATYLALKLHGGRHAAAGGDSKSGAAQASGAEADAKGDEEKGSSGPSSAAAAAAMGGAAALRYDAAAGSGTASGGSSALAPIPASPSATSVSALVLPDSTVKGSSGSLGELLATDLTKLPGGFNDVSASDFTLVRTLGAGSFAEVWLARYCETTVAVKMMGQAGASNPATTLQQRNALLSLQKEAGLMAGLRHPNVCQYLGACTDPPCLLMEYCSRRSVDCVLASGANDPRAAKQLSWGRLLAMALDAAKGMLYLHSRPSPIAHRDLKSANLLVDTQWRVKVSDFNLSKAQDANMQVSSLFITNPRWLAPEVLSGHAGQLPADVWAFGTVLWELATWRLPFENANAFQIITIVQNHARAHTHGSGLPVPRAEELPAGPFASYPQYVELMEACWAVDPSQRPGFAEVVQRLRAMLGVELKQQQQQQLQRQSRDAPQLGPPSMQPTASAELRSAPAALEGASGSSAGGPAQAALGRAPSRSLNDASPFSALAASQFERSGGATPVPRQPSGHDTLPPKPS